MAAGTAELVYTSYELLRRRTSEFTLFTRSLRPLRVTSDASQAVERHRAIVVEPLSMPEAVLQSH